LADAQLTIAREHGFPSWRALKQEVDRRSNPALDAFLTACAAGDISAIRELLRQDHALINDRSRGTTALHAALPHPDVVRFLLEQGADPNLRDRGDTALPLHFAAGGAPIESVRALIDGGSDVHGFGDLHELEVIGWATIWREPRRDVVELLVQRGARHHVFSAIALSDPDLIRRVVQANPQALARRLSRFEGEQSALHYVIAPPDGLTGGTFRTGAHYMMLEVLLELGAEIEARDGKGRTPMDVAMLRGDKQAMQILHAAGARQPEIDPKPPRKPSEFAKQIGKLTPMLVVADMKETMRWYESVGFEITGSHGEDGQLDWAEVKFGEATIMFVPTFNVKPPSHGVSLWIHTERIDELYASVKHIQLERGRRLLEGRSIETSEIQFTADLYTAFYGQREFGIRDPNGIELMFFQPLE
jgi:ankyrin repeat protein/uncharacterized glyoxalase superfamily protein PhnB